MTPDALIHDGIEKRCLRMTRWTEDSKGCFARFVKTWPKEYEDGQDKRKRKEGRSDDRNEHTTPTPKKKRKKSKESCDTREGETSQASSLYEYNTTRKHR